MAPATIQSIERLLLAGDPAGARAALDALAAGARVDAALAHDVAQLYMHLKAPAEARDFYARALATEPGNGAWRYNHATALIALGRLEEAEAELDRVIVDAPTDWDAWYNRSTLRRQTAARNHVNAIRHALMHPAVDRAASVPLEYALAKELEDLGEHEASFAALRRGADARRALLSYDVRADVAIMAAIADTFGAAGPAATGCADPRPVFVVGLPRSGTTLVDRMLSSHSSIGSHGESSDFALSLMQATGPASDKDELLRRSAACDPQRLGAAYVARLGVVPGARVVDKTPSNFLYLGLIARALPQARIVHVRRRPMDVCYAMYKTLFRMAYPFSYDLDDLARYWIAFDALMRRWQAVLPAGRMISVDYEDLVTAPEANARRLLQHVGLPWEDACLHFDRNPLPSLTASAAQVRQPIYTSSVGLWRHYRRQLAPLAEQLRAAGADVDDAAGGDGREAPKRA